MQDGITKAIEVMGEKITTLECELSIYKHMLDEVKKQKAEADERLAKLMEARSYED